MDVVMPQLGETVAEGKILTWFKKVGDEVAEGDNIFEVETDKVTIEVQAIASGRLSEIRVGEGGVVKVGTVVAVIGEGGAAAEPDSTKPDSIKPEATRPDATRPASTEPASSRTIAVRPASPVPAAPIDPFNEVRTARGAFGSARAASGLRVSPLARRLIAQNGIDLDAVAAAAGARGDKRILERHVRAALAQGSAQGSMQGSAQGSSAPPPARPAPAPLVPGAADEAVPLNTIRQRTGERLAESWRTAPHVFQAIDVDFSAVDFARARHKERFRTQHGLSLTYLPFIARAACQAIREFPHVNARFDGNRLLVSRDIHLGIAVDLSHNGLVVCVVRGAGDLTLEGLAKAINRQVEKARAGKLTPDDMTGATYTITNNGAFGTMFTAPIINVPQVAILSTDAIRKRPAVVETPQGDFIAVRPVGILAHSFDHRAFDGAYSAAFLSRLKQIIQQKVWVDEFK
jgi:pyruvate/2-oxoglutarate dehydrogenase complex dihydrolipoamide acyltransferase (E2) component